MNPNSDEIARFRNLHSLVTTPFLPERRGHEAKTYTAVYLVTRCLLVVLHA